MSQNFLDKYCKEPPQITEEIITKEEVIKHFTDHIEKTCINEDNIVHYSMPSEFIGKISSKSFWEIISDFLYFTMGFEYDMGWKMEYINDIFYKFMNL